MFYVIGYMLYVIGYMLYVIGYMTMSAIYFNMCRTVAQDVLCAWFLACCNSCKTLQYETSIMV